MTSTTATKSADASLCIHIVRDYPHPPAKVWRALTDPALMALWADRPEGFRPIVGTRFKFVGKAQIGWRGWIDCQVLEARAPHVLRYSWQDDDAVPATEVSYLLEPHGGGTRFTFDHTGFTGVGRFFVVKLVMEPSRRRMFATGVPAVLDDLDDDGRLRRGSLLKPKRT